MCVVVCALQRAVAGDRRSSWSSTTTQDSRESSGSSTACSVTRTSAWAHSECEAAVTAAVTAEVETLPVPQATIVSGGAGMWHIVVRTGRHKQGGAQGTLQVQLVDVAGVVGTLHTIRNVKTEGSIVFVPGTRR